MNHLEIETDSTALVYPDATVSFSSPAFTVIEEAERGSICVTIEDDIERTVTVMLTSTEQCEIYHSVYEYLLFFILHFHFSF